MKYVDSMQFSDYSCALTFQLNDTALDIFIPQNLKFQRPFLLFI